MEWATQTVVVTGAGGFIGHHLLPALAARGVQRVVGVRRRDCDLTRPGDVERLFRDVRPTMVFHLAGRVGGILANKERPGEFLLQNALMGLLVLEGARRAGVGRLVAVSAGCAYPETAPVPLKEEAFWDGYPQAETAAYSMAKRLLHAQAQAYAEQYGFGATLVIPGNIYGPHDNFDPGTAPVLPALVRKFVEAREQSAERLELMGSGRSTRDFLYASDCAEGLLLAAEKGAAGRAFNISSSEETSIRRLAEAIAEAVGWQGDIRWHASGPEGQSRRWFDISRARRELGFEPRVGLREGLALTVEWFARSPAPRAPAS